MTVTSPSVHPTGPIVFGEDIAFRTGRHAVSFLILSGTPGRLGIDTIAAVLQD